MTLRAFIDKAARQRSATPQQFEAWQRWLTRCYVIFR